MILRLTKVWVNLVSTGEAVSAASSWKSPYEETWARDGDVRTYAGGRRRAITQEGDLGKFDFTLLLVGDADYEKLKAWQGLPVQVRDTRGRRFFGSYFAVPKTRTYRNDASRYDVGISLQVITLDEGVTI